MDIYSFRRNQKKLFRIGFVTATLGTAWTIYYYSCPEEHILYTNRTRRRILSKETEKNIGDFMNSVRVSAGIKLLDETILLERIREIGNRICDSNKIERRKFYLQDSREINSYSVIGDNVILTKGILPFLWNDSRIAMLLSHEIAHGVAGHHVDRYKLLPIGALAYIIHGLLGITVFHFVFFLPYSRKQEHEADEMALYMMTTGGYDPYEAMRLYLTLEVYTPNPSGFVATHPPWKQRVDNLRKLYEGDPFFEKEREKHKFPKESIEENIIPGHNRHPIIMGGTIFVPREKPSVEDLFPSRTSTPPPDSEIIEIPPLSPEEEEMIMDEVFRKLPTIPIPGNKVIVLRPVIQVDRQIE
jgi:predicted Zn-dependent protease